MDVLVCVKRVPGTGSTVLVSEDAMSVDTRHLGFTIGPHEECAVEEAVRIVERCGGSTTVLTVGPQDAGEQLRSALSTGADHAVLVDTGARELDAVETASAITQGVRALEADGRHFDLVLFGNESADAGNYQVGIRVACELGLPMVNGIKGIEVDAERRQATLRRDVPTGVEVYSVPLPTAVGVKEGLNLPRYPSMRGRLRAMKAPLRMITPEHAADNGIGVRRVRLRRPPEERPQTVVLGHGADAAGAVADVLEELGMLR